MPINSTGGNPGASGPFLSELHRTAVEYALDGWFIFPVVPNGKEPLIDGGFKSASRDIEQINKWWRAEPNANIGMEPGRHGLAALDIEPDGLGQIDEFRGDNDLPRTFTNRSPRGGEHRFYRGDVQSLVRPFKREGQEPFEIDTRGRGGYVLLPPSRTIHGQYETIDESDVAKLPQWIPARLAARKHDRQRAPDGVVFDTEASLSAARSWMAKQMPPVQGERNDRTYKAACTLKDLGISPETSEKMLLDWVPLSDDFTAEEVHGRIVSAFENGQNEPGCYAKTETGAEMFGHMALDKIAAANVTAKVETTIGPVPFSTLLQRDVQPVAELIPGLIEKGVATMLAGPGGVHKSRTAVHWGLAISAGQPVYGRQTEQARFVFLSYEDHPDEVARRSQAMTRRLKCDWGANAEYWDMTGSLDYLATVSDTEGLQPTKFFDRFRAHLHNTPGHKFVAIDSTYNALAFLGQAKISEPAVKGAIEFLNHLCRETDSTIVFLWHPSQAGQERGDASGWSVAWHNAPRARVSLSRAGESKDTFELKVEKRNNAAIPQPLTLHWDDAVLLPISAVGADEAAARFTEACVKVALESAENGSPITKQRHLHPWQIKEIEFAIGKRPTDREVKAELARALNLKLLRYVIGYSHQQAGYYPFEVDKGPFLADVIMPPNQPQ